MHHSFERIVLHLDLNYFFAQAEELRKPELKCKPVVVCVYSGRTPTSGAVGTSNYLARALGIKSGQPIFQAQQKATPETVFLPVDIQYYKIISIQVMEILKSHSDSFESGGVDEAFIEITQACKGNYKKAKELAEEIKKDLLQKTGLICSIGIAPNKLLAKIASDFQKPDGLTILEPFQVQKFINPLSVSVISGIGPKTAEHLKELHVEKVSELAKLQKSVLIQEFGNAKGDFLFQAAQGLDESPVQESSEHQQFSRMTTLKKDSKNLTELIEVSIPLMNELCARCQKENIFFKTISIVLVSTKLESFTKAKTVLAPTHDLKIFQQTVQSLFSDFLKLHTDFTARRLGISVSHFSSSFKPSLSEKQRTLNEF
ncbi:MAG: DNA polymerase IV [Candidatus Diapherotrites archaeon]|nr:DNA polymerase IV [Candidatus Diapherotrites archaeon]